MAYIINRYNGSELVVLNDGTVDTSTSISLVGKNYTGYGEYQNENFVFLLENFASEAPPPRPISGQMWYNTTDGNINVYDGTDWNVLGSATVSDTAPETPATGMFWLKTPTNLLYVWTGGSWFQVGEAVEGFGTTKAFSTSLLAQDGRTYPVVQIIIDDLVAGMFSRSTFDIANSNSVDGFTKVYRGLTLSTKSEFFSGTLKGLADRATVLENIRTINGVGFDGSSNITIKSPTTNRLIAGDNIIGSNFDGSAEETWSVEASANNIPGKIVARDTAGNFSAGTITASLIGNVTGNVTATSGTSRFKTVQADKFIGATLSGNAASASQLQIPRKINGVDFNGTKDITVGARAQSITGDTLASNVLFSSLQTVGTLQSLEVENTGITIGSTNQFKLTIDGTTPYISNATEAPLNIGVVDSTRTFVGSQANLRLIPSSVNKIESGVENPALVPEEGSVFDLGQSTTTFRTVYADTFEGVATAARYADLAEFYSADRDYDVGTVLVFGGDAEVTETNIEKDNRLAGVVSAKPGYTMNTALKGTRACIALQGRVPCKVIGTIKKGEMLTTSSKAGYAIKATDPDIGTVIGKALEDKTNEDPGVIEVAVGRV